MIKLFVTDLDGCITIPFEPPAWDLITKIRDLNRESAEDSSIPPLSICSGRPYPYVEAVAQWLDIRIPVIFESGGMYDMNSNYFFEDGAFDEKAHKDVNEMKQWLRDEILPQYPEGALEFAKLMDAGFIHPRVEAIDETFPVVKEHVDEHYPEFEVHRTDVSVNIILSKNNKRAGILKLCDHLRIEAGEVAYIGDSGGDIPALEIVGHSFSPANAVEAVKKVVDQPLDTRVTGAVLEAYRHVIGMNRNREW